MAKVLIKGGGGGDKPKLPVITTQEQLDRENAIARRLATLQGHVSASNVFAAKKVGDPIPQYIDAMTGKPYIPSPVKTRRYSLPNNVTIDDIKSENGFYWYEDPSTGDIVDVDPTVVMSIKNRIPLEQAEQDKAKLKTKLLIKKSK